MLGYYNKDFFGNRNVYQNFGYNSFNQCNFRSCFPGINIFNYGNIGNINIGQNQQNSSIFSSLTSLLQGLLNNRHVAKKRPVKIDKTEIKVEPKPSEPSVPPKPSEPVHGYTKTHQLSVEKMTQAQTDKFFNLYDVNKDGVFDIDEAAALNVIKAGGKAEIFGSNINNMWPTLEPSETPSAFLKALEDIKSGKNETARQSALSWYNSGKILAPGLPGSYV